VSSWTGFLKGFGQAMKIAGTVVGIVNPSIQAIVQSTPSDKDDTIYNAFMKIFKIVMDVEAQVAVLAEGTISGTQKLLMATPLVMQVIYAVLKKLGLKIANLEAATASVQQIISGVVGLLNACHEDAVKVEHG